MAFYRFISSLALFLVGLALSLFFRPATSFSSRRPRIVSFTPSASSPNPRQERFAGNLYQIRPFNSSSDLKPLQDICRTIFQGNDYLPSEATVYEEDPTCNFQVLVAKAKSNNEDSSTAFTSGNDEILLAVANLRYLDPHTGWLEAVRTSESYRGQGHATRLISNILGHDGRRYKRVLSSTIPSNLAMQRVFKRVGMQQISAVHMSDFAKIAKLPGYNSADADEEPCQNLLDALGITHLIPSEAKSDMFCDPILDEVSLDQQLKLVSPKTGMMPGVWKVMSPTTPQLKESLKLGLVYALHRQGSCQSEAIMAFVRDKPITSLSLPWVLCLAGSTELHLCAALWHACFSAEIQQNLRQAMSTNGKKDLKKESSGNPEVGFVVAFDARIQLEPSSAMAKKFPLGKGFCIYSTTGVI